MSIIYSRVSLVCVLDTGHFVHTRPVKIRTSTRLMVHIFKISPLVDDVRSIPPPQKKNAVVVWREAQRAVYFVESQRDSKVRPRKRRAGVKKARANTWINKHISYYLSTSLLYKIFET